MNGDMVGRFEATFPKCAAFPASWTDGNRLTARWARAIAPGPRRKAAERQDDCVSAPARDLTATSNAYMMTIERDALSKTVARVTAIIEDAAPALVVARDLMDRFHNDP